MNADEEEEEGEEEEEEEEEEEGGGRGWGGHKGGWRVKIQKNNQTPPWDSDAPSD